MEADLDAALDRPVGGSPVSPVQIDTHQQIRETKGEVMKLPVVIGVFVLLIGAGVGTGWGASKLIGGVGLGNKQLSAAPGTLNPDQIVVGQVYGQENPTKFKDVAEGIIQPGGIDGEGTHHLVRPGGASQTVYLTSSTVDLDLFVGDKVELRGETFSAQKAAWFMDVGSVKVLELNAQNPDLPTNSNQQLPSE